MENFFAGAFISAMLFTACYALGFGIIRILNRFSPTEPAEEEAPPFLKNKPKRKRRQRAKSLTISLNGTALSDAVVITDGKKQPRQKATTLPSPLRPRASRGGRTTSARR